MKKTVKKVFSVLSAFVLIISMIAVGPSENILAADGFFTSVGGWNETIYAQISGISKSDVTSVSYSGTMSGSLTGDDFEYLVRDFNGGVRIDIPGIKAGTYTLTVTTNSQTLTQSGIVVNAQDRSGFAHFNYTSGVGAYNDDGTLKENAIVLYVTNENKNSVTLRSKDGTTVTGIGNILNSAGQDAGTGKNSNGGTANSNQDIMRKLAKDNTPLVIRIIGTVSDSTSQDITTNAIDGLTVYNSVDMGGTLKDNGHMARIRSGKDITIEGIGYDAVVDGWGFHFMCSSGEPDLGKSFEVRNLTFINTPEDAIGMEGEQSAKNTSAVINASVERCWIHHNSFYVPHITNPAESDKAEGDGSVDFKRGQYFTCSYNYFEGCHKTNLVGSADYSLQYNLTYHHNYWKYCKARGPLARNANIHMYNNVFEGQTDYAMNTRADAYIFSEYNLFYMCKSPQAVEGGAIKSFGDSFANYLQNKGSLGTVVSNKSQTVSNNCKYAAAGIDYSKFDTNANLSYIPSGNYILQENVTEAKKVVYANAGVMKANPVTADAVSMADISLLPSGTVPAVISELPYSNTSIGKINKSVYAFTVNSTVDVTVAYASEEMSKTGVLVNEAGEAFLMGSGTAHSLPAGTYMIQPANFQPGDSTKLGTFKEITINSLQITGNGSGTGGDSTELQSISLNMSSATLTTGDEMQLTVSYQPSNTTTDKTVTWTTSNGSVAEVSNTGVVTAKGAGTATITATVAERFMASCEVTVVNGQELPTGEMIHNFTTDEKTSSFYTFSGDGLSTKYTTTYNGESLTKSLKLNSNGKVEFTAPADGVLTLVFAPGNSGNIILINETEITIDNTGIVRAELQAGPVTVVRKKSESNLFFISFVTGN